MQLLESTHWPGIREELRYFASIAYANDLCEPNDRYKDDSMLKRLHGEKLRVTWLKPRPGTEDYQLGYCRTNPDQSKTRSLGPVNGLHPMLMLNAFRDLFALSLCEASVTPRSAPPADSD